LKNLDLLLREKKATSEVVVCRCLTAINPESLAVVFKGATFGPRSYEKLNDLVQGNRKYEEFEAGEHISSVYGNDT